MSAALSANLPTVIVGGILLVILVLITRKMIVDRKNGKSSCGCGCSSCAMKDSCHSGK